MLLTHVAAGLSTEPDGMFFSYDTVRQGRVSLANGVDSMEVIGTPDMTLEIVSPMSVRKDKVILPELYHRADVSEYWLVEPVGESVKFDIFVWTPEGYESSASEDGWARSPVFGRAFQMDCAKDPLGIPLYKLKVR